MFKMKVNVLGMIRFFIGATLCLAIFTFTCFALNTGVINNTATKDNTVANQDNQDQPLQDELLNQYHVFIAKSLLKYNNNNTYKITNNGDNCNNEDDTEDSIDQPLTADLIGDINDDSDDIDDLVKLTKDNTTSTKRQNNAKLITTQTKPTNTSNYLSTRLQV